MAIQRIYKVGTNNFKFAVLKNETDYLCPLTFNSNSLVSDFLVFADEIGVDLTPLIISLNVGEESNLINFKDGSRIYFVINRFYTNTIDTYISATSCQLDLYYITSTNVITYLGQQSFTFKGVLSGVTIYQPLYLALSSNTETKKSSFIYYYRDYWKVRSGGNGAVRVISFNHATTLVEPLLYNVFAGTSEYDPDPWSNGGYADIGGGDGELDLTSDPITLPSLPTSICDTGFIQVYTPSLSDVTALSNYMWHGDFLDNLFKLFSDPMDIIIGLSIFPFPITSTGSRFVTAGNIVTTVTMPYTNQQFVELDCGYIDVKNFYNAYIDYEPYTSCEIFLPYIGYQKLCIDDIMGKRVRVIYRVDLLTGLCIAFITANDILLYSFTGSCSTSIPISTQSFTSMVQTVVSVATSTTLAGKPTKSASAMQNAEKGAAGSLASNVLSFKPDVQRSGSVTSSVGMLGAQKPHFIFSVPRSCLPKGQNKYLGYPSFMSTPLSSLTGYTVVEDLRLENMTCTEDEQREIVEILKGGVIL